MGGAEVKSSEKETKAALRNLVEKPTAVLLVNNFGFSKVSTTRWEAPGPNASLARVVTLERGRFDARGDISFWYQVGFAPSLPALPDALKRTLGAAPEAPWLLAHNAAALAGDVNLQWQLSSAEGEGEALGGTVAAAFKGPVSSWFQAFERWQDIDAVLQDLDKLRAERLLPRNPVAVAAARVLLAASVGEQSLARLRLAQFETLATSGGPAVQARAFREYLALDD